MFSSLALFFPEFFVCTLEKSDSKKNSCKNFMIKDFLSAILFWFRIHQYSFLYVLLLLARIECMCGQCLCLPVVRKRDFVSLSRVDYYYFLLFWGNSTVKERRIEKKHLKKCNGCWRYALVHIITINIMRFKECCRSGHEQFSTNDNPIHVNRMLYVWLFLATYKNY